MLIARGWDAWVVSFYRGAIGLVISLVWLSLRPAHGGWATPRLWFWSVVAGLGVAGNFAFYFVSIAQGSVAVAATLMYSAPVFVYLVSFLFGLERATGLKWTAIAVVLLGIVLLTQTYDLEGSEVTPLGVGAGLLAGICYAVFIFGFKNAASHGHPPAILAIAFAVVSTILLGPAATTGEMDVFRTPDWPLFAALGALGAGLSFALYVLGVKHTAPSIAAMVAMVEPVTAALFGIVVLSERLERPQILGMALILVTVTALSVSSRSRQAGAHRSKP